MTRTRKLLLLNLFVVYCATAIALTSNRPSAHTLTVASPTQTVVSGGISPSQTPVSTASPSPVVSPTATVYPTEAPYSPGPQPSYAMGNHDAPLPPTNLSVSHSAAYPVRIAPYPWSWSCREGEDGKWSCGQPPYEQEWYWSVDVNWTVRYPSEVTVRLYAVTACLHGPDEACVAPGDQIDKSDLVMIAESPEIRSDQDTASGYFHFTMRPASDGRMTGAVDGFPGTWESYPRQVYAYLVQTVSQDGGSPMAIADTAWQHKERHD